MSGYTDGGDAPDRRLQLVPGALDEARALLNDKADTQAHFASVSNLVDGFESPFGLELLATVHWIAIRTTHARDLAEIVRHTHRWNESKKQFTPRQIKLAYHVLWGKGWLSSAQPGRA